MATPSKARQQIYRQLHPWQTRLVKLLPGKLDNPLRCELLLADITFQEGLGIADQSGLQKYEALSYCWGEQTKSVPIECNSAVVEITLSLADALKFLRFSIEPRWLWIDALCINQEDNLEKYNQVQLMLIIYAKALRVIAWLGLPNSGDYHVSGSLGDAMLAELSHRPYFRRTWVVQEIFAAQDLIFQCGTQQFDASYFDGVENVKPLLLMRGAVDIRRLLGTKGARTTSRPSVVQAQEFFMVLAQGRDREVSDPRDSLFAVLGMLNNQYGNAFADFAIDYQKSSLEISAELVKYTIRLTGSYRCVADVFMISSMWPSPVRDLPSWLCCLTKYAHIAHYQRNEFNRKTAHAETRETDIALSRPRVSISSAGAGDLPDLSSDPRTLIFRGRIHPHSAQRVDYRPYVLSQHQEDLGKLENSISFHEPVSICGTSTLPQVGYLVRMRTSLQADDVIVASHRSEEMLVLRRVEPWQEGGQKFSVVGVAYAVSHRVDGDLCLFTRNYYCHADTIEQRHAMFNPTSSDDSQLRQILDISIRSKALIHPMHLDGIYVAELAYGQLRNEALLEKQVAEGFPTFNGEERDFVLV